MRQIAGDRPESGVRIALERPREQPPPWRYCGAAHLPDASFPLSVAVSEDGAVEVGLSPSGSGAPPPAGLVETVRRIVRAAYRQARADGAPPAWRIVRWRGEK